MAGPRSRVDPQVIERLGRGSPVQLTSCHMTSYKPHARPPGSLGPDPSAIYI